MSPEAWLRRAGPKRLECTPSWVEGEDGKTEGGERNADGTDWPQHVVSQMRPGQCRVVLALVDTRAECDSWPGV